MLDMPDFIDNKYVSFENGRFLINESAPEEEKKILKKKIFKYKKKQLNHLNKWCYCGFLDIDKNGNFILKKNAPDDLKKIYHETFSK